MLLDRFIRVSLVFTIFSCVLCSWALAAQYPQKAIRLIVPYGQGGATDTIARMFAGPLEKALFEPVVVINKPGAGGAVGLAYAFQQKPDGYTIALGSDSSLSARPLMTDCGYTSDDIQPIARVIEVPMAIAVVSESPVNDLDDLIETMKRQTINWSSPGIGSGPYLGAEVFFRKNNVSARHVTSQSAKGALVKLLSGEVEMISVVGSNIAGMIGEQETPVKVLGVATKKRWQWLPDSPTFIEQGYEFERPIWFGFVAPKGTPGKIIEILAHELRKVLSDKRSIDLLTKFHMTFAYQGTEAFADQIRIEKENLSKILDSIGMSKR